MVQVFAFMGQLEFFYDQVPDDMQTIGTALFTSNTGVAHFVCTVILQLVTSVTGRWSGQPWIVSNINQSRLDKYYWMLTVLSALNCVAFFLVSLGYTYKTTERHEPEHNKVVPAEPPLID
jgi:peptide/histidine transporter 3/4